MRPLKKIILVIALLSFFLGACYAEGGFTPEINLKVEEFRLGNGMLFLVVERHASPQVACRVAIRAGSALEDTGKTGIAHMLEHMMFKGTKNFGTTDSGKDQELQDKIEAAYQAVLAEERKRDPDQSIIKARLAEAEKLRLEVQEIYVPQAFSSQLGKNGAVGVNAFTSKDQTQYVMSIPSDMLEQWFSIVSEQLFEPSWREFYVEKEVIQREWASRYVNDPDGAAWLDLNATAYTAHPYRNPVIGWKSDMERFNTRDAMEFHRRYYNPTNAVVVLVGDLEVDGVKALAESYFGRYPGGSLSPEKVTKEPLQEGPRKRIRFMKGARKPLVRIGFHGASMGTKEFYALDAMTMVLGHGRGARLTQEVVNKGLALNAWAFNPDNRYAGMVIMGGSPNEPDELREKTLSGEEMRQAYIRACEGLEKALLSEVERLKKEPVPPREMERIRKLSHRDFLDKLRTNEDLADALANLEVEVGWRYAVTYLDRISQVTPQEIMDAAKRFVRTENMTSVYVIPEGVPEQAPEPYAEVRSLSGSAARKLSKVENLLNRSAYPTPPGWEHPLSFERTPSKIIYPRAETSNVRGAPLFYLPDNELPLVDLAILVKAGEVDNTDDKYGLAQILGQGLILGGTEGHSPSELAMVLDEKAIHLSVSVDEEMAMVKLSVMKEDWDKGLGLLREVLTRPRFDPDAIEVLKEKAVTHLKRQGGDAHTVSMREGMTWHFKGHPYGRDPLVGLKTIPQITREDLMKFLRAFFVPSNMVVCVAGDIEKGRAVESLERLFEAFPEAAAPPRSLGEPPETPPVLSLIPKPGQVQSQVFLALRGLPRSHPDYWKLSLLMNIFGGSDSLMYTRLRDDLGLVYAAGFRETFKWKAGMLIGYLGCKGDMTSEALLETVKIMKGLGRDVPEEELEHKRLDALNSFVFNVDTPAALVEAYGRYAMRGEPLDTLERIQDSYLKATKREIAGLAKRFLDPKKLQVFVVADKKTKVARAEGTYKTLEEDLRAIALQLGLPYQETPLR